MRCTEAWAPSTLAPPCGQHLYHSKYRLAIYITFNTLLTFCCYGDNTFFLWEINRFSYINSYHETFWIMALSQLWCDSGARAVTKCFCETLYREEIISESEYHERSRKHFALIEIQKQSYSKVSLWSHTVFSSLMKWLRWTTHGPQAIAFPPLVETWILENQWPCRLKSHSIHHW